MVELYRDALAVTIYPAEVDGDGALNGPCLFLHT